MRSAKTIITASLLFSLSVITPAFLAAGSVEVPIAKDLHSDSQLAASKQQPLLLMFSAQDCPFCITVEEEFLEPMRISGDYKNRILMRKVMLDGMPGGKGFSGSTINPRAMAKHYKVFATPTVIFVDHTGKEVAKRLVGINTVDYYGAYLDQSIDEAVKRVRLQTP